MQELTKTTHEKCETCKYFYYRNGHEQCQIDDCGELCMAYSNYEPRTEEMKGTEDK